MVFISVSLGGSYWEMFSSAYMAPEQPVSRLQQPTNNVLQVSYVSLGASWVQGGWHCFQQEPLPLMSCLCDKGGDKPVYLLLLQALREALKMLFFYTLSKPTEN